MKASALLVACILGLSSVTQVVAQPAPAATQSEPAIQPVIR